MTSHKTLSALVIASAIIAPIAAAHAGNGTIVVTKGVVCESENGEGCQLSAKATKTYQDISITVPSPGTIAVTISAYGGCINLSEKPVQVFIDTQIMPIPNAAPKSGGDSGKRTLFTLAAAGTNVIAAQSVGLDSTRTIHVSEAGKYSFYFRHNSTGVTAKVVCLLIGGNMTATFVPK
jgi:hypothetical protein